MYAYKKYYLEIYNMHIIDFLILNTQGMDNSYDMYFSKEYNNWGSNKNIIRDIICALVEYYS